MTTRRARLSSMLGLSIMALAACEAPEAEEDGAAESRPAATTLATASQDQPGSDEPMGFFITSVGMGNGGDLGGLEGADNHCQTLAAEAGAGDRTWRAYLSTQATGGQPAENARDRIGEGPWHNANGLLIASGVDNLHYDNANIRYEYALDEHGERVNSGGMGDSPNEHDILTGTQMDGTAFPPDEDRTCNNWTSSGDGSAFLGHHDRFTRTTPGGSWNAAHASAGCSQASLEQTGGAGLFYCFAAN